MSRVLDRVRLGVVPIDALPVDQVSDAGRRGVQAEGETDLAIVAVSARLEPGQEPRLEQAGADAVLDKALGPELIAQAVDAVLERKRMVAQAS